MPRTEVFDRAEVLTNCRNAFWAGGYHGTSMQDLVDSSGLNRSSIYNSFGSKLELYLLCLEEQIKIERNRFDRASQQQRNGIETIGLLFLFTMEEQLTDETRRGCLLLNSWTEMANHEETVRTLLSTQRRRAEGQFRKWVQKGQEDRSITTLDSMEEISYQIMNAYQGFKISIMQTPNPKILKQIVQRLLKSIT